jgi:F0F1-type ATP synthase membrane subunit a
LLERTALFVFTFLVVVYVGIQISGWRSGFFAYFLQAEKWLELVFLLAISYAVTTILAKLLQWEYRVESGMRAPRKRR